MAAARRQALLGLHASILLLAGGAQLSQVIDLPAFDLNCYRAALAAAFAALLLRWRGLPLALPRRLHGWMGLTGALMGLHWATYYLAMQTAGVAVGILSLYTYPVMVILLEPLLTGARWRARELIAGLAVMLGIWLIVPEFSLDNRVAVGAAWGLFSALLYALRNVLHRRYFTAIPAQSSFFWYALVSALVLAGFTRTAPQTIPLATWAWLLLSAVAFTTLAHTLYVLSLNHLPASRVGLIASLQPFYATLLAALLFQQWPAEKTLLGGLVIVGVAMVTTLQPARKPLTESA